MKLTLLGALFAMVVWGCNGGAATAELPAAAELLSTEAIKETVQEPVRKVTPVAAGLGEHSACVFQMPARTEMQMLHFYLYEPAPAQDIPQLQLLAGTWQEHNAGAGYEILQNTTVPMAWFPGEAGAYPATLIALFQQATVVTTGVSQDDAKSLVYQIMVKHNWK